MEGFRLEQSPPPSIGVVSDVLTTSSSRGGAHLQAEEGANLPPSKQRRRQRCPKRLPPPLQAEKGPSRAASTLEAPIADPKQRRGLLEQRAQSKRLSPTLNREGAFSSGGHRRSFYRRPIGAATKQRAFSSGGHSRSLRRRVGVSSCVSPTRLPPTQSKPPLRQSQSRPPPDYRRTSTQSRPPPDLDTGVSERSDPYPEKGSAGRHGSDLRHRV